MSAQELLDVRDHLRLVRGEPLRGESVSDGVERLLPHAGLAGLDGVGGPLELAIHLPRHREDRQLLLLCGQLGLEADMSAEMGYAPGHLGAVEQYGERSAHAAPALDDAVIDGAVLRAELVPGVDRWNTSHEHPLRNLSNRSELEQAPRVFFCDPRHLVSRAPGSLEERQRSSIVHREGIIGTEQ
jgi:hypothetical protein